MFAAVFLTSLSAIAFEILLARVFSLSQWHHLSFMVISIALFGMAASGTYLSLVTSRTAANEQAKKPYNGILQLTCAYSAGTLISFYLIQQIPLDYYKLPIQPIQALFLMVTYLLLAAPFFFAGLIISRAYVVLPEKAGVIYFMTMAGSALGAALPVSFLKFFGEGRTVAFIGMLPLLVCFLRLGPLDRVVSDPALSSGRRLNRWAWAGGLIFSACLVAVLFMGQHHALFRIPLSEYKALQQLLQFPDTRVVDTRTSIRGRVDVVHSPYLRFSPGLSLQYEGALPRQFAQFKDGDGRMVYYDREPIENFRFAQYTLSYAGYRLAPQNPNVLIIQEGGGSAIACALASGASDVRVIEKHPQYSDKIRRHYHLETVAYSPFIYLTRNAIRFDVIHLENWGASFPGATALSLNHLFTIDAMRDYLDHLTESGVLIVARKLILPPSHMIRVTAAAYEGLRALGVAKPADHVVILRNWDTFTLVVSKRPIQRLEVIQDFARQLNFDLVWPQNSQRAGVNQFNTFEKPYYADAVQNLFAAFENKNEKNFYDNAHLDIAPQDVDRPFPDKFFKWRNARSIHRMTGSRLYTLLLSGEIIITVVFVEALVIAALLLISPLWFLGRHASRPTTGSMLYFFCVGAGFIFVEMYFIYSYTRLFNDPVLSFAVVLAAVLISSSLGGLVSQRLPQKRLTLMVSLAAAFLFLMRFWFEPLLGLAAHLPPYLCWAAATLLLIPASILLGIPFPLAMRSWVTVPSHRAYAWASNGIAAILAAIISAQLAISYGLTSLLACAVLAYALGAMGVAGARYRGRRKRRHQAKELKRTQQQAAGNLRR